MEKKPSKFYRLLEMIPGLISWNVILFLIWGSFIIPSAVAYFVIGFLVFWFYQTFKSAFLAIKGFAKIKKSSRINWFKKYQKEKKKDWLAWEKIKHVVIIPTYNEAVSIIARNIECIAKQKDADPKNIVIVLAMEKRAKGYKKRANQLIKMFDHQFAKIFATYHPANIPGEIKGKASNESWAAKKAKEMLVDKLNWDLGKLTITSCDADTCFHPKYFSALTYYFAKDPNRHLKFWQSPIFLYNNLDKVPIPIKIVSIIGNIIHIAQLNEPEGLFFNQSSYSLSFKLLDKTGYWDTDIIPEDWHLFLQTFFANKGRVSVTPIFLPTNMDAPEGKNRMEALKNRYLQCQRHAWGATDIPYTISQAIKHPEVPLLPKLLRIYKLIESHFIWATNWFILTLGASLPPLLNPKFFQTSFGYNLPKFSQTILTICLLSLVIIMALDWKLDRKNKKKFSFSQKVVYVLQWLLMPIATLFMSVLPGLHAQTKLLLGRRMEYWVTKKY